MLEHGIFPCGDVQQNHFQANGPEGMIQVEVI